MIEMGCDELGAMLGISGRRVQQLESEKITFAIRHGVYDVVASVRAYCDYIRGSARGTTTTKEQKEEQTRLIKARADIAELNHLELNGELVRVDIMRRNGFRLGAVLKNNLETIADRQAAILAAETSQDKIHDILTKEVKETLNNVLAEMDSIEVDTAKIDIGRSYQNSPELAGK